MTNPRREVLSSAFFAAALALTGSHFALGATNYNAYIKGTFEAINYDNTHESDRLSFSFDGAGNFTIVDVENQSGSTSTFDVSGTYSVASDGTFTLTATGQSPDVHSGTLSADGNTFVLTDVSSGGTPQIIVGTRTGWISSLNQASGIQALASITTGATNTAAGSAALQADTTGSNNTAFGANALESNIDGKGNAAQGVNAMINNTHGIRNLGIGNNALYNNLTGSYNVGLGFDAGYNSTGNDNIYVSNMGVAGESQTLRLGSQGISGVQGSGILSAFIAGVYNSQLTGSAVYVTSSGQLGVLASSERFKTDVETMDSASEKLAQLRPVTFKLKTDPQGTVQYGLIAEEVASVYPELVIHGADGRIDGVRYEELAPMLLNEMQQERREMRQTLAAQAAQIRATEEELAVLKQQLLALSKLSN